jgi:hypothetical protein
MVWSANKRLALRLLDVKLVIPFDGMGCADWWLHRCS